VLCNNTSPKEEANQIDAAAKLLGVWTAIGIGIGAGLGLATSNLVPGVAVGVVLGVAVGVFLDRRPE
jgi:hypothetical protein